MRHEISTTARWSGWTIQITQSQIEALKIKYLLLTEQAFTRAIRRVEKSVVEADGRFCDPDLFSFPVKGAALLKLSTKIKPKAVYCPLNHKF